VYGIAVENACVALIPASQSNRRSCFCHFIRRPDVIDGFYFTRVILYFFFVSNPRAHRTELSQTLPDVGKWTRFQNVRPKFGIPCLTIGAQNIPLLDGFRQVSTIWQLSREYHRNKTWYRRLENGLQITKISYIQHWNVIDKKVCYRWLHSAPRVKRETHIFLIGGGGRSVPLGPNFMWMGSFPFKMLTHFDR